MQTGRKILNLRLDHKMSQQDLAKACSILSSTLSKIETGISSPRTNVIWKIARNLGVTVEYLLDEEMSYPQGIAGSSSDLENRVALLEKKLDDEHANNNYLLRRVVEAEGSLANLDTTLWVRSVSWNALFKELEDKGVLNERDESEVAPGPVRGG